jgi:hypothetical protein
MVLCAWFLYKGDIFISCWWREQIGLAFFGGKLGRIYKSLLFEPTLLTLKIILWKYLHKHRKNLHKNAHLALFVLQKIAGNPNAH